MGRFLDGGLLANNPTLDAMAEIHQYNKALKAEVCNLAVTGLGFQPFTWLGFVSSAITDLPFDLLIDLFFIVFSQGRTKSKKLGIVVSLGTGEVLLSVTMLFFF